MTTYAVLPMFWGPTFPNGATDPNFPATPYVPGDYSVALRSIASAGYFSLLRQYGADQVTIADPFVSTDAWPDSGNGYYVADFTEDQVVTFIKSHLGDVSASAGSTPIYAVVIPNGSLLDVGALGAHHVFDNNGQNAIWFWMYGSDSLSDACRVATHEIDEAIGANGGAPKELCDDCKDQNPNGRSMANGLLVETYFDRSSNMCVAPGALWGDQQAGVGGGTSGVLALAEFNNALFAAWKGAGDDQRMFWSSFDGTAWSVEQVGIGGGTSNGIALATFGGLLYAAWKGAGDDQRMFWSRFDGAAWSVQLPGIGGGTSGVPALASYQGRLYAAWKGAGDDQRMFWSSFDGTAWSVQQPGIGGGTSNGVGLATVGGRLFAAWKGAGADERMFWSSFDGAAWSPQLPGIGGGTSGVPALASYKGRLHAAWKGAGADERMFWSVFDGTAWSDQLGVGGGTSVGPALSAFRDQLFASWKGVNGDDRMFWASISEP